MNSITFALRFRALRDFVAALLIACLTPLSKGYVAVDEYIARRLRAIRYLASNQRDREDAYLGYFQRKHERAKFKRANPCISSNTNATSSNSASTLQPSFSARRAANSLRSNDAATLN